MTIHEEAVSGTPKTQDLPGRGGVVPMDSDTASDKLDARLMRVALVFVVGSFMSILDSTIVNIAIKDLSRAFNSPLPMIQWVSTGYILAVVAVIPLTGWGCDRFGTKRLYMGCMVLFLVGSALCGAAWSAGSLIVFRLLQGLGGGMIVPCGMTIVTHAAGAKRIGRVMGIVGAPMLMAPILGPIIGGYFVDYASWRWIFFVNLPIGAVAVFLAAATLESDAPKPEARLDWMGLVLLSPGLAAFVYGLTQVASGAISSTKTTAGVAIGLLFVIGFILHARHREDSLIDVDLFARHPIGASSVTTFLIGSSFFGLWLVLPLYFQIAHGKSASDAGLLVAVQGVGAMITMPISGRLTDKAGAGKIVLVGLTLSALGVLGLSQTRSGTPMWQIEIELFITGLGSGASMMPAMSAALGALRRDEVARATTGLNVVLRVGGSIGTALLAVVLTHEISRLLGSTGLQAVNLSVVRNMLADGQARTLAALSQAFGHTFLFSLATLGLAFIAALFLPRQGFEPADAANPALISQQPPASNASS
ncbi:MAG TPA: DHA2 family efflux MFS transporter permease subunit [Xanthobacteraceae bacterium]|nr:DHA2 family efflux MFS transporter permease subunit [Xanthobacteraceae bacterium]